MMENYERKTCNDSERLKEIGYEALSEVAYRYGIGRADVDTDYPPAVEPLAYHNASHTLRVREATAKLAQLRGLNEYDHGLAVAIASAHDVYHDGGTKEQTDEEKSAYWLVQKLAQAGFSTEDQAIARLTILGTTPIYDTAGNFTGQQFTHTDFPSMRAGEIALCVAAADMESVFHAYGPTVAHDLFKEWAGFSTCDTVPDLAPFIAFQKSQIEFVRSFTPLYPELEQILGGLRAEVIKYQTRLTEAVANGEITTWEQVVAADEAFALEYTAL